MVKIIWMSDPHFADQGDLMDHDPRIRLQAAIDHINQHHDGADFCVISGDMVNRGTDAGYRALQDMLSTLSIPVMPMVGNHDDRTLLRDHLPLPQSCMEEFVQYRMDTPDGTIACLDTLKPGSDAGEMCSARFSWLHELLQAAGDTPVYLFMHHPPMPLGLPIQDTENLLNGDTLLNLLSEYNCVKHLFIGHVHRPITGTIRGIPFATMRSVALQAPAPRPAWTWETFQPAKEAPNLGVLTIEESNVTLHYEQFCGFDLGVTPVEPN